MFALDRDLAVLDPSIFRDLTWMGQTVARGTGTISSDTLAATGALDVDFEQAQIGRGHVVNIGGVVLEVDGVKAADALTVTVLRPSVDDPPQPPEPLENRPFTVLTFRPQLHWVHRQLMAMLGLRAGHDPGDGLTEGSVTNPGDLARIETLGALHLIYAAAGALEAPDSPNNQRARAYRQRYGDERTRTAAFIDTDGDGRPDAARRLNVFHLTRL
ncbi:MAG: hypothetical protein U0637_02210 [Phycisphaerales bacterium]